MTPRTEVHGADELARTFERRLPEIADDAVRQAAPAVERIADRVRGALPHVSGALESSVFADDEGAQQVVGYDGTVPYAGWIEFGGTRSRPYVDEGRFLYPFARDATDDVVHAMEQATQEGIDQTSWPNPTTI